MSGTPTGRPWRLGIVAGALHEDIRKAAPLARAEGFAGLQLDPRVGELDLASLSQSGRRELLSILRANELELVGLRLDLGAKGLGAASDIDAGLDRIEKFLPVATGLMCPMVCIELGPPPAEAATLELGRRADRHGVMLAFRGELMGFADLERAVRTGDCPWFGLDFDPVAALRDDLSGDEIFSRMGQLIRHVRGRDAILGAERRTKPAIVGSGSVDWRKLLADLAGAAFAGWITIDPVELAQRRAAAQAGATALREI